MPRVRTVVKHVTELQPSEVQVLKTLTMGAMGRMRSQLDECRAAEDGWAVVHYDNSGSADGWTLLFLDKWGEYYNSNPNNYVAYFYVNPDLRRNGIGSALMRHARRVQPEPFVCPWSDESRGFFSSQDNVTPAYV